MIVDQGGTGIQFSGGTVTVGTGQYGIVVQNTDLSTTTDANGLYVFIVNDGTYNLTINIGGFDESVVNGVNVSGADLGQNVVLLQQASILSGVIRNSSGAGAPRK